MPLIFTYQTNPIKLYKHSFSAQCAAAIGITIARGCAQFHVNFHEFLLIFGKDHKAMITIKAESVVGVRVHCISMIHKEFNSTVLTFQCFTGVGENKGEGDGVRRANMFHHVVGGVCHM